MGGLPLDTSSWAQKASSVSLKLNNKGSAAVVADGWVITVQLR